MIEAESRRINFRAERPPARRGRSSARRAGKITAENIIGEQTGVRQPTRPRPRRPFSFRALPRGHQLRAGDYAVSTVRPTIRPARKSSSAACASPSGRLRVGIGAMFLARAKSSSSRASASVPVKRAFDGHRLDAEHGGGDGKIAAEEPGHDDLAAARQQAGGELQRFVGANEIADRQQSAAGRAHHRLARQRIGWIVGLRGAGRERGITLLSIDIGDNRRRREKGAGDGKAHHADAAETDEQDRAALGALRVTFERGISGKPRAHERPGEVRGQRRVIKQVALMRNQNVGSKAAVDGDTEMAMVRAQILFAAETRRANPAADPRIDGNAAADDRGVASAPTLSITPAIS